MYMHKYVLSQDTDRLINAHLLMHGRKVFKDNGCRFSFKTSFIDKNFLEIKLSRGKSRFLKIYRGKTVECSC